MERRRMLEEQLAKIQEELEKMKEEKTVEKKDGSEADGEQKIEGKQDERKKVEKNIVPNESLKEDQEDKDKDVKSVSEVKGRLENTPVESQVPKVLTMGQTTSDVKNDITLAMIQEQQTTAYNELKKVIATKTTEVLKMTIKQPDRMSFELDPEIKLVEGVPCFFKLKASRTQAISGVGIPNGSPEYIKASVETFGFGIRDVRVEFASENLSPEIKFDALTQSIYDKIIGDKSLGALNDGSSNLNYAINVLVTIFTMAFGSQVLVKKVDTCLKGSSSFDSSDLMRTYGMVENKFINQSKAILPCGGYQNAAEYLLEDLKEMFHPENRRMKLGEVDRVTFSQRKLLTTYACVTDQYFSTLNDMFLRDLHERTSNSMKFLVQLRSLTFKTVDITIPNELEFKYIVMPNYRRVESSGYLIMYILSTEKQDQLLTHLRDLLNDTCLLSFRTNDQLLQTPMIIQVHDQNFKEVFLRNVRYLSPIDVYFTLACDLSTTWVNCRITTMNKSMYDSDPVQAIMNVFIVILWFNLFPAVAIDCANVLMETLFRSLKIVCPREVSDYLQTYGYIEFEAREPNGARRVERYILSVSRESYLSGAVRYPFLVRAPQNGNGVMATLRRLLELNNVQHVETRDNDDLEMIRMRTIRGYVLPWSWSSLPNVNSRDQPPTPFSDRLERITEFLKTITKSYKNKFKDVTSKSALGTSQSKAISIIGFLDNFTQEFRNEASATVHAHLNKLRELGQNSPYVLDDTFRGQLNVRTTRPQFMIKAGEELWRVVFNERTEHDVPFEVPFYYLMTSYVSPDVKNVVVPDPLVHFKNVRAMMSEGRLFGDVVSYVNAIKYSNVGNINGELQGLSPLITTVNARNLIEELAKSFGKQYAHFFSISMSNTSRLIDSRGMGYKISLNTYGSVDFSPEVNDDNRNPETLYNVELNLRRELLTRMYTVLSKLFIPETSPVFLYVRGIFIESREVIDLNPMDYIDVEDWIAAKNPYIVLWSNSVVRQVMLENDRMTTRTVFRISVDGQMMDLYPERGYRKILFILTANTGSISSANYDFIFREFKARRIAFVMTDLLLTINRVYANVVGEDYNLEGQLKNLFTSYTDSRLQLTLLDTTAPGQTFGKTPHKEKWFYLMSQYKEPDVVLTGMDDYYQRGRNYRLCSPFMWAYGVDGKSVEVLANEDEFDELNRNANIGESAIIDKTDLKMVNFNNNLTVIDDESCIKLPTVDVVNTDVVRRELEADDL